MFPGQGPSLLLFIFVEPPSCFAPPRYLWFSWNGSKDKPPEANQVSPLTWNSRSERMFETDGLCHFFLKKKIWAQAAQAEVPFRLLQEGCAQLGSLDFVRWGRSFWGCTDLIRSLYVCGPPFYEYQPGHSPTHWDFFFSFMAVTWSMQMTNNILNADTGHGQWVSCHRDHCLDLGSFPGPPRPGSHGQLVAEDILCVIVPVKELE